MATNGKTHETDVEAGATITRDDYHWDASDEPISFGFRTSAPPESYSDSQNAGEDVTKSFSKFTSAEETGATTALDLWASVANISLTDSGETNNAVIELGNYKSSTDGGEAFTFFPGSTVTDESDAFDAISGDGFYNTHYMSTTNDSPGTYEFGTFIHETGHSLGLEHPGDYNAGPGQTITYANDATYYEDSEQYTIMSYFLETNTGANFKGFDPQTPMIDDIEAIQNLYGPNLTTRTDDTTYGFNAKNITEVSIPGLSADETTAVQNTLNSIYNFSVNKDPVFCIYDAGGINTLDCSGYSGAQTINLNNGSFSSVMGLTDNISISDATDSSGNYITHVQIAIGGKGNDTIISGAAGDTMTGGAGANTFEGTVAALDDDTITDFSATDKLDITDLAYGSDVSASFAAGVLSVGTTALTIDTSLTSYGFSLRSDGDGGTLVSLTTAAPALAKASDTGASATDSVTSDSTPTLTGTVTANASVTLVDQTGTVLGTAIANSKGAYSITPDPSLGDGTYTLHVVATDATGDVTTISASRTITIDTTPPDAPTVLLTTASDSGNSSTDGITKVTKPTITGTADAGTTVTLYDGTKKVGSAVVGQTGTYSITTTALAVGTHNLSATAVDVAGNVSASSAILPVTIDTKTVTPSAPKLASGGDTGVSPKDNITSVNQPTITGTAEAGATVDFFDDKTILLGSSVVQNDGTYSFTPSTALSDGVHSITAKATDVAGNISTTSGALKLTIDSTVPAPTMTIAGGATTAVTISGSGEAGSTVTLTDNGAPLGKPVVVTSRGTWSLKVTLPAGDNDVVATDTDKAGNQGTTEVSYTVPAGNVAAHNLAMAQAAPASSNPMADFTQALFEGFFGPSGADATATAWTPAAGPALTASDHGTFSAFKTHA